MFVIKGSDGDGEHGEAFCCLDDSKCGEFVAFCCAAFWFLPNDHGGATVAVVVPFSEIDRDIILFVDIEEVRGFRHLPNDFKESGEHPVKIWVMMVVFQVVEESICVWVVWSFEFFECFAAIFCEVLGESEVDEKVDVMVFRVDGVGFEVEVDEGCDAFFEESAEVLGFVFLEVVVVAFFGLFVRGLRCQGGDIEEDAEFL